ncbi:hypothetical protein [Roseomonas sp. BN140053]|uniref:hypothetical protein n=1 Tax=Roseomonas sp. BN140053 TaxID=3391898 RepID=UPI0039EC5718
MVGRFAFVAPLSAGAILCRAADRPGPALALAAAALAAAVAPGLRGLGRALVLAVPAALAFALWEWPELAANGLRVLPAVADLLLCWHFGRTLLPGREPLISFYTRHDFGHLPPECAGYTRGLTALWTAVFAALAGLHAAIGLGAFGAAGWTVLAASLGGMAALFLGEHVVRSLRFPQHGMATPARTWRAMLAANAAPHG